MITLAAWLAGLSQLGVVLLASLTIFLGGSGLGVVREGLQQGEGPLNRLLHLVVQIIPDFSRFNVEAPLAASQAIALMTLYQGWMYFGVFTCVLGACAWWTWRRTEL